MSYFTTDKWLKFATLYNLKQECEMKLKEILCMLVIVLSVAGCGKSNSMTWTDGIEPVQMWQEKLSAEAIEESTLQECVLLFVECHEETIDYGLAYGMTAMMCQELDICNVVTNISDEELASFFGDEERMYLLDFSLPMFETYYFDEETAKYVQAAAVSFAEYLEEQEKLEEVYRLSVTDAEECRVKLVELKNGWLLNLGLENTYEPFAMLQFSHNDERERKEYPYVMKDEEANWYFSPDDIKEHGYKTFVAEYLSVKELMELDFADARELFKDFLPENVPAVDIYTRFYEDESFVGGYYIPAGEYIELYTDWETAKHALLHEYVHYLTMGKNKIAYTGGAFAEGIAEEAAVWGCENRLRTAQIKNRTGMEEMKESAFWDEEKGYATSERTTYIIAQNFYAGQFIGMSYNTVSQRVIEHPETIEHIGLLSYYEMASLTHYLIELYGRVAVYENYYDIESFEEFIGKDFFELYDEWAEWNLEQCHELGAYFIYE